MSDKPETVKSEDGKDVKFFDISDLFNGQAVQIIPVHTMEGQSVIDAVTNNEGEE